MMDSNVLQSQNFTFYVVGKNHAKNSYNKYSKLLQKTVANTVFCHVSDILL